MITPTQDQLAAAYAVLRKPDWPDTLDATLRGPHAAAVRLAAWRLANGHDIESRPANTWPHPARPARAPWAPPLTAHQPPLFDRKRLAAGDDE